MDRKLWEQLPVYRRLENEVKRYIAEHRLKRHDRLPSESQLAAEYGASIGTIRKALNNLVAENIIYRRHGQGTFVSPRSRKGRILVVPGHPGIVNSLNDDYFSFLLGALDEANTADLPCEPVLVDYNDFYRNLSDVKMIYPETAGVIFFRGYENLRKAEESLLRQGLPILFYGPNIYEEKPGRYSAVYHNESAVAALLAEYYASRGFRRVLSLRDRGTDISQFRHRQLEEALRAGNIECENAFWEELRDAPEILRRTAREFDVISCARSAIAIEIIQQLERELHLRVPDTVAVAGIDDLISAWDLRPRLTVVDLCNNANARLCIRKFSDLVTGGGRNFHIDGRLELIRRESC
ncbi:MAG: GntR family transcriptional regulator [Lentisphaeria bacterium]|nr:GntR family transcriptional regulator [Lentisphaeria bacterium]